MRHRPIGGDDEAQRDEPAGIEFGRQCAGDGEHEHEHQPAGGDGHAGLPGAVAHDLLEELRHEDGGGVERDAHQEHDQLGHSDVAAGEQAQVEDGVLDGELAPEEDDQPDDRDDGAGDDEAGAEPVVFLALVEQHLQGADGDDEQAEAPVVDAVLALADVVEIRRIFDERGW